MPTCHHWEWAQHFKHTDPLPPWALHCPIISHLVVTFPPRRRYCILCVFVFVLFMPFPSADPLIHFVFTWRVSCRGRPTVRDCVEDAECAWASGPLMSSLCNLALSALQCLLMLQCSQRAARYAVRSLAPGLLLIRDRFSITQSEGNGINVSCFIER